MDRKNSKEPKLPKDPEPKGKPVYGKKGEGFKQRMGRGAGSELGIGTAKSGYGTPVPKANTGQRRGVQTEKNRSDTSPLLKGSATKIPGLKSFNK